MVRLRALYALEALLERGRPKKLRGWLRKHGDAVVGETGSSQRLVRQRAEAVADLVWPDGDRPAGRAARRVEESGAGTNDARGSKGATAASSSSGSSGGDMLAFLDAPAPQQAA